MEITEFRRKAKLIFENEKILLLKNFTLDFYEKIFDNFPC